MHEISPAQIKELIERIASRQDWLYIFSPCSIGDFFYNGGLSHAVQERKEKVATVLVVKERMRNLHVTYDNLAQVLYLPDDVITLIQNYCYLTADYEGDNYIYGHFKLGANGHPVWDESLHLIDRYKKDVFAIPLNTPYLAPIVDGISSQEKQELRRRFILDKEKTVVLVPYVHSTKQLDMSFWERIVRHLKKRGFLVYTNTDGFSEQPVAGSESLTTNFPQLYFISDKVRCFLGSRNGLFDFLCMTEAKTLDISPFPDWLWDSSLLYPESNNRTFYNAVEYLRPVADYFTASGVRAEISLSHEKIKPSDIFCDYDELITEIVNAV